MAVVPESELNQHNRGVWMKIIEDFFTFFGLPSFPENYAGSNRTESGR